MEYYEKKISFLGENIQIIRKHRGMKQQELANKIGINMQSLSKIERGVNYPTFDTLEKIIVAKCWECCFCCLYLQADGISNHHKGRDIYTLWAVLCIGLTLAFPYALLS